MSNHRRKVFFHFTFVMTALHPVGSNRPCITRSNNMAFAFLVESDDTIPTNHEGLACAWDSSHGKETGAWTHRCKHGDGDQWAEISLFLISNVSSMDQEVLWAVSLSHGGNRWNQATSDHRVRLAEQGAVSVGLP